MELTGGSLRWCAKFDYRPAAARGIFNYSFMKLKFDCADNSTVTVSKLLWQIDFIFPSIWSLRQFLFWLLTKLSSVWFRSSVATKVMIVQRIYLLIIDQIIFRLVQKFRWYKSEDRRENFSFDYGQSSVWFSKSEYTKMRIVQTIFLLFMDQTIFRLVQKKQN